MSVGRLRVVLLMTMSVACFLLPIVCRASHTVFGVSELVCQVGLAFGFVGVLSFYWYVLTCVLPNLNKAARS